MTDTYDYNHATVYNIRLRGALDATWSDWLGGLTINIDGDETVLSGLVTDQSALHGILAKINDLGLSLISVNQESQESSPMIERIQNESS
jgi:hypothetical protein